MTPFMALLACGAGAKDPIAPPPEPEDTLIAPADEEVERNLAQARIRAGSPPDVRERDRAIAWLLSNADRAFPEVLRRAEASPEDAVMIDLVGRFRRPEAVPLLERAFAQGDRVRPYAAAGLGQSSAPAARAFLVQTLSSSVPAEVAAALGGLEATRDLAVCPDVRTRLDAEDAEIRWSAVHAAASLGCLSAAEIAAIAQGDADAAIRQLAADLAKR